MTNPHVLYEQLQRVNERSINEFERYVDMSISGITHGRKCSEQAIAKQKAKADKAENAARAVQRLLDEAIGQTER